VAGWVEPLVYFEVLAGLIPIATVLHFRRAKGTGGELPAVRRYFLAFFVLLLALPCLIVVLTSAAPAAALVSFGWTFGKAGLGAGLVLAGLPLSVLAGANASRDPAMRAMYPLAKAACADTGTFVRYELAYLVLYYLPWEFLFRGVLFLPLVPILGLVPALAGQTIVSTLFHIGHPGKEIWAAAGAGLAFGLMAYFTGSFFYPLVLHAATGLATDTFLFIRGRRVRA
jgi:membrane protease YdiL (CAAX protease family)